METFLSVAANFLSNAWRLFTIPYPGFSISIGGLFISIFIMIFAISMLRQFLGIGFNSGMRQWWHERRKPAKTGNSNARSGARFSSSSKGVKKS